MISKESKERILKRLQQENARSPYLNSLPGRLNSYSKLDLAYLPEFNNNLITKIPTSIASGKSVVYYHDSVNSSTIIPHDNAIQRCLKNIVDKAKINLTETGSETLAVGYPMLITRSSSNTTDCKAIPLFIWPVTIKTEKVINRWRFSFSEEIPMINQSLIGYKESDKVPINLGTLYNDFIEENLDSIDPEKLQIILDKFIADNSTTISRVPDSWETLEKMPFETKTAMKDGSEQRISMELYNSAVLTNYKESKYSIIRDFNNFGDTIPDLSTPSANVHAVSASVLDPSQFGVIEDINSFNHVVLHGPPGTGKSQTITGIITAGLANNLKIAVVCQKAAAINVLIDNLSDLGISKEVLRVTNISTDRKDVIEKARAFENAKVPSVMKSLESSVVDTFNNIGTAIVNAHLRTREEKLTEYFNWNESVGTLSNLKRLHPTLENIDYSSQGKHWSENSEINYALADELDELLIELSNFGEHAKHLNTDYSGTGDEAPQELRESIEQVNTLVLKSDSHLSIQRRNLSNQQEAVCVILKADLEKANKNLHDALELKKNCEGISKRANWMTLKTNFASLDPEVIKANINTLNDVKSTLSAVVDTISDFLAGDEYKKFNELRGFKKFFASFTKDYKLYKRHENDLLSSSSYYGLKSLQVKEFEQLLDKLKIATTAQSDIDQLATSQLELFEKHVVLVTPDGQHNASESSGTVDFQKATDLLFFNKTISAISNQLSDIEYDLTEAILFRYEKTFEFDGIKQYQTDFNANSASKEYLNKSGRLFNSKFSAIALDSPEVGFKILTDMMGKAIHLDGVISCFNKSREFNSSLEVSERGKISFRSELTYGILKYATQNYYEKHKNQLPKKSFNNKIVKQGENLKVIQKQVIKKALYNGNLRRAQAVDSIEKKASSLAKVFSHRGKNKKTLRQITQRYKNEFTELFPVLMMTPEVSCNLFEGSHLLFDLVIVDEASQVELHDILPVLYKGKTLVIAGDQHQMPPSNFFSKQIELEEDDDDDDMEPLIDVESLLEFCQSSPQFKSRFLDFHYRSNHEGLINFSNDAIYKRLVVKPTKEWEYAPFLLSRVHNGIWVNQRNEVEAQRVIGLIKDLDISQRSVPHVLVATLNAPHRKEIQDQIASEISENPEFEKRMQLLESHGFDIKNLENLQGDECDVLIISTGYGKGPDGVKFRQNLGVVNQEKGYRLLNVLITRAKYKVILVTSIPKEIYQSYIDVLKSGKTGRGLLYAYIAFVEAHTYKNERALKSISQLLRDYGIQSNVIGDTRSQDVFDSPFEEEVYEFLIKHYSPEKITLQEEHINSGFRIDMVLKPAGENGPRIAIECDGAAFHSGWRNQTLDLHRQNLLEDAGYEFIRVWSTDWWRDQEICESSILAEVKTYLKGYAPLDFKEEKWLTLEDEIIEDEEWESDSSIVLVSDDIEEIYELVVSKDCIVNLSTNNKLRPNVVLSIVPNQGRMIKENTNGIIYLVFNADLPMALIGNKVGSSVNFNNTTYKIESIE